MTVGVSDLKLSNWLIVTLLACAAFFAVAGGRSFLYGGTPFGSGPMLATSGYSLLLALLLHFSGGMHRAVMTVATAAILLAFVGRLVYLTVLPFTYRYAKIVPLDDAGIVAALLFMVGGTLALWAALRITLPRFAADDALDTTRIPGYATVLRYWHVIVVIGYVNLIARTGLRSTGIIGSRTPDETDAAFLFKLVLNPTGGLGILIMFALLMLWDRLRWGERLLLGGVILGGMLDSAWIGSRGALLQPFTLWLIVAPLVRGDVRIPRKLVAATAALGLAFVPVYLQTLQVIKVSDIENLPSSELVTVADIPGTLAQVEGPLRDLSGRMSGFDALVAVMAQQPDGTGDYLRLDRFFLGTISRLVPKQVYEPNVPSSAKLFAVFYQGVPWEVVHVGGWYGFGFFFGYLGWLGMLGMGALGAIVGLTHALLRRWAFLGTVLWLLLLNRIVWGGMTSGNFDALVSGAVIDGALIVIWVGGAMLMASNKRTLRFRTHEPDRRLPLAAR